MKIVSSCTDLAAVDSHLILEVALEFGNAAAPVLARFLRDELDVEEGALARSVRVAGGGATHNPRRHVRHQVLARNTTQS